MMTLIFQIFLSLLTLVSCLSSFKECETQLADLDRSFSSVGPNIQLLQDYEALLSTIVSSSSKNKNEALTATEKSILLPKIYYKKGLIELFLGKESKAIADFQNCIEHDNSMNIAKVRLLKLYLLHGKYKEFDNLRDSQLGDPKFKSFFESNGEIKEIVDQFNDVKQKLIKSEDFMKQKKYSDCINMVSNAISISPSYSHLYNIRLQCSINAAINNEKQKAGDETTQPVNLRRDLASNLIPDYLILEKLNPLSIENYINLSHLYFFGLDEFENAAKHIRKGLHYDMDDKDLKQYSLFFKRSEKVLKQIKKFKDYNAWLFNKEEVAREEIDANYITSEDYAEIIQLLFHEKPNIPVRDIRRVYDNKEFANNFEFFEHLDNQFNEKFFKSRESNWQSKLGFSKKSSGDSHLINGLMSDLNKIACVAYLSEKKLGLSKPYCLKVLAIEMQNEDIINPQEYVSSFLPSMIFEIQKFIKSKDLTKLKPIYEKFKDNENLKKIPLFNKFYGKIEKMFAKQQQKFQQQQQQQQRQQQQQNFRQQQYQNQQRQNSPPKNDYYKVLGVDKGSSDRDIKTAYRNLVKKYHPDKYKGEDAEEKMAEINTAYEVLSDEELRERYNRGDDPNDRSGGGGGHQGGNPFANRGGFHNFGNGGNFQFNFGGFDFGGFGGNAGPNRRG